MHDAVANTVRFSDASLPDALRMASANPAALLGISDTIGSIDSGRRADLVLFEWDGQRIEIMMTVVNGNVVYESSQVQYRER